MTNSALNETLKVQGWKDGTHVDSGNIETASTDNAERIAVQIDEESFRGDEVDASVKSTDPTPIVPNAYIGKRNIIHKLMDVALLLANVSQLKALLATDNNDYFPLLLTFICLSISLQVVFTICMLIIWSIEKKLEDNSTSELSDGPCRNAERKKWLARMLDRVGNVIVLFIIVSNVFIAGFGVENHKVSGSPKQT